MHKWIGKEKPRQKPAKEKKPRRGRWVADDPNPQRKTLPWGKKPH